MGGSFKECCTYNANYVEKKEKKRQYVSARNEYYFTLPWCYTGRRYRVGENESTGSGQPPHAHSQSVSCQRFPQMPGGESGTLPIGGTSFI